MEDNRNPQTPQNRPQSQPQQNRPQTSRPQATPVRPQNPQPQQSQSRPIQQSPQSQPRPAQQNVARSAQQSQPRPQTVIRPQTNRPPQQNQTSQARPNVSQVRPNPTQAQPRPQPQQKPAQKPAQPQNQALKPVAQNKAPAQKSPAKSANQPEKLPVRRTPVEPILEDSESYREWQRRQQAQQRRDYARESASSAIMSAVKAVIYIVCVIAVSIPLSIFVINTANDVFAFVKEEQIIEVTIPEYATIEDIGDILGEAGVIEYPWAFKLWSNLKERSSIKAGNYPEFIAGTYQVNTTLNYDYLRATFKKRTVRETVDIMIPEGYTVDEIIDLFVSYGIGTREGFIDVINNHDFDYRFIDELTVTDDRTYRLEGYLFPDTYQFYTDSSEVTVINKLLQNFNVKFAEGYYARCIDLKMTVDEAITLASMIEKEARYANDFGYVSSVFHNRLKYSSSFPYLNSDATIMYAIQYDTGSRLDTMTGSDTEYDSPYNTYTHRGLPPGPIANPGLNAIKYALYPNDSNYLYFVSNSAGHMLYAETDVEHQKNIITARSQ